MTCYWNCEPIVISWDRCLWSISCNTVEEDTFPSWAALWAFESQWIWVNFPFAATGISKQLRHFFSDNRFLSLLPTDQCLCTSLKLLPFFLHLLSPLKSTMFCQSAPLFQWINLSSSHLTCPPLYHLNSENVTYLSLPPSLPLSLSANTHSHPFLQPQHY